MNRQAAIEYLKKVTFVVHGFYLSKTVIKGKKSFQDPVRWVASGWGGK